MSESARRREAGAEARSYSQRYAIITDHYSAPTWARPQTVAVYPLEQKHGLHFWRPAGAPISPSTAPTVRPFRRPQRGLQSPRVVSCLRACVQLRMHRYHRSLCEQREAAELARPSPCRWALEIAPSMVAAGGSRCRRAFSNPLGNSSMVQRASRGLCRSREPGPAIEPRRRGEGI